MSDRGRLGAHAVFPGLPYASNVNKGIEFLPDAELLHGLYNFRGIEEGCLAKLRSPHADCQLLTLLQGWGIL